MEKEILEYINTLLKEKGDLEKEITNIEEDREVKKQALLSLIALNMKLFAEKDEEKVKEIKNELSEFVQEISLNKVIM